MPWKKPYTPSRDVLSPSHRGMVYAFPSHKTQQNVGAERGFELAFCHVLAAKHEVIRFWEQPPAIRWKDDDGVWHQHTPDFATQQTNGNFVYEVKPKALAETVFKRRTEIVTERFAKKGLIYEVWSEDKIFLEPRFTNSKILTNYDVWIINPHLPLAIVEAFERFQPRTLAELEEHVIPFLITGRCDLFHMAVRRHFNIDILNQPIGDSSRVSLGPINFEAMV